MNSRESSRRKVNRDGSRFRYHSNHKKGDIMKYAVILYSEVKEDMMKKIMYIVEEEINRSESETSRIRNIKDHLDDVFGSNWNIFMADCRCWSLKTYKQGTNVVFEYDNMVYDIYQAPENTPNVQTKGTFCPLYN